MKDSYLGRSRCPIANGYFNIMISDWSIALSMHKFCLGEKWRTVPDTHSWCCGTGWNCLWLSTAVKAVLQVSMFKLKNPRSCFVGIHPSSFCSSSNQTWPGRLGLICVVLKAVLRYSKRFVSILINYFESPCNPGKVICANFHQWIWCRKDLIIEINLFSIWCYRFYHIFLLELVSCPWSSA